MTGCGIGKLETAGWSSDWRLEHSERPMILKNEVEPLIFTDDH